MKKLLCCLLVLIANQIFSQEINFEVKKSPLFEDEYSNSTLLSVDEDGKGGVVTVRVVKNMIQWPKSYVIEHFDANMKRLKKYSCEIGKKAVMGVIVKGSTIHIIEYGFDKARSVYVCSAKSADVDKFQFTDKELFTVDSKEARGNVFTYLGLNDGTLDMDYAASYLLNREKTAFAVAVELNRLKEETQKIYVYDTDLNLKIEHRFVKDVKDKHYDFENIELAPGGDVAFLLGKVQTKETRKRKKGADYQYELTRITAEGSKSQTFDSDQYFTSSLRTVSKNGGMACVGFYSDKSDFRALGLCYYEIDPATLDVKKRKYNPFTEQFLKDKFGTKKQKEIRSVDFRSIFVTPENDIVFNAEEYWVTYYTMGSTSFAQKGDPGAMPEYWFFDIISAKMNDAGDLIWARAINKAQHTKGYFMDYVSYTSMIKGEDSYFFINCDDKIKNLGDGRISFKQDSPESSNLNVIRIDRAGNVDYREVIKGKETNIAYMAGRGGITQKGNQVYFMGEDGTKRCLLKIIF